MRPVHCPTWMSTMYVIRIRICKRTVRISNICDIIGVRSKSSRSRPVVEKSNERIATHLRQCPSCWRSHGTTQVTEVSLVQNFYQRRSRRASSAKAGVCSQKIIIMEESAWINGEGPEKNKQELMPRMRASVQRGFDRINTKWEETYCGKTQQIQYGTW